MSTVGGPASIVPLGDGEGVRAAKSIKKKSGQTAREPAPRQSLKKKTAETTREAFQAYHRGSAEVTSLPQ